MMTVRNFNWLLICGLLLTGFLAAWINRRSTSPGVTAPKLSYVSHAPSKIFAPGRVEGATEEVELRPQLAGMVAEVAVAPGQQVDAGQVLLRLIDDQYRSEVDVATARIAVAEAERDRLKNGAREEERREAVALYQACRVEFDQAQRNRDRLLRLREEGAIPFQELDDQEARVNTLQAQMLAARARAELLEAAAREDELKIADAKIISARAQRQLAQVELERAQLRAPFSGQVLEVHAKRGELAGPNTPEPAVILADTSRLRVRAFVEEMDAPRVRVGMRATVTTDGLPGKEFLGRISRISPRMTHKQIWTDAPTERQDTKSREVWIDLDTHESLIIGLRADVLIDPDAPKDDSSQRVAIRAR